jgi:ADP-sugar diphosphatase
MKEKLENAHKFQIWKQNLIRNGMKINGYDEIYSRYRPNGEVLFSLIMLDAEIPEGGKIPPILFLKGQVLSVLICLIDAETKEKYLLVVKQRRICDGSMTVEHTAGMIDGNDEPIEVAIREVEEETGMEISVEQLVLLNSEPFYPSSGTSDEAMFLYYCEIQMDFEDILAYNNKNTGAAYESEKIITGVLPFKEAHQLMTNSNAILLNYMYLKAVKDWDLLAKI